MIKIYNTNNVVFYELEKFLNYFYSEVNFPISIQHPRFFGRQILYNTEQLTRPKIIEKILYYKNNFDIFEIWDYSVANIKILNSFGVENTKHVPFRLWPEYREELLAYSKNDCEFDVGFCGHVGSRYRKKLLNKIKESGLSLDLIRKVYGQKRDIRLSKCKIILNIHFNKEYNIFEQYRCFGWLEIGKTIISENSLDNDSRCINVNYEKILPTIFEVLNRSF